MYFFNVNALARDLRDEKVSERDKFRYLIGTMFLSIGVLSFTHMVKDIGSLSRESGIVVIIGLPFLLLLNLIIFIGGMYLCYETNRMSDNKNFIERFICLSFPLLLTMYVIRLIFNIVSHRLPLQIISQDILRIIYWVITILLLYPLYYFILLHKIKFVAQKQSN